jgi:hypothetical protein
VTLSGTTNFNLDLADAIEEAYERAGRRMMGGYDYRTARRSIDLMMTEWANRGLNLWLVQEVVAALPANTPSITLPADTVDVIECVWRTNSGVANAQSDLDISRVSVSDWATIPNKLSTGSRPLQFYINRLSPAPVMQLWPVADGSQAGVIGYWRLRRVQDTSRPGSNDMDIPFRFLPALVSGLAYHLALKNPELMPRVAMLKQVYDETWQTCADEDRDRSPVRLVPYIQPMIYY